MSNDPEQLLDAIRLLIKNPELARITGEAARDHAVEHFGLGRFLADWDDVLDEATR